VKNRQNKRGKSKRRTLAVVTFKITAWGSALATGGKQVFVGVATEAVANFIGFFQKKNAFLGIFQSKFC